MRTKHLNEILRRKTQESDLYRCRGPWVVIFDKQPRFWPSCENYKNGCKVLNIEQIEERSITYLVITRNHKNGNAQIMNINNEPLKVDCILLVWNPKLLLTICHYCYYLFINNYLYNVFLTYIPSRPTFLHFHAVFRKIWPNTRLAPLQWGLCLSLGNLGTPLRVAMLPVIQFGLYLCYCWLMWDGLIPLM